MRAVWLADAFTDAGLTVHPHQGWETRGQESFTPKGVMWHHTVTSPNRTDAAIDQFLAVTGSSTTAAPLCNYSTNRDGSISIIAAGTANHGGVGKWNGVSGNRYWVGDEMKNAGTATEPWSGIQLEAARLAAAVVLEKIGSDTSWLCGHKEYAPKRKRDPHSLDMNTERLLVATLMEVDMTDDQDARLKTVEDQVAAILGILRKPLGSIDGPDPRVAWFTASQPTPVDEPAIAAEITKALTPVVAQAVAAGNSQLTLKSV